MSNRSAHRNEVCERYGLSIAELYDLAYENKPDSDRWWYKTNTHRMRPEGIAAVARLVMARRQLTLFDEGDL